jgi:hypothetical protein
VCKATHSSEGHNLAEWESVIGAACAHTVHMYAEICESAVSP